MPRPVTKTWPRSPSFFIFVILNSQKLNEYDLELLPRLNNKTKVSTGDSEEVSSVSMQSQNKPCGQREQMARGQSWGIQNDGPLDGIPPWEMPICRR